MATKIRLTRLGKKKQPTYRVVVMDSRKPRDGKYIEQLGIYDPRQDPSVIKIDNERALYWLNTGAQPTERAQKLLEISGAWTQFKVAKGEIHTVGADAEEPAEEPAEEVGVVEQAAVEASDEEASDEEVSDEEVSDETTEVAAEEVTEEEVVEVTTDSSSDES
jgi:small subunit ribosomal protein S16